MICSVVEGDIKVIYTGGFMSGDVGLEQPIIFYDMKMTETKMVLLSHRGIKFNITTEEKLKKREWNSMTN